MLAGRCRRQCTRLHTLTLNCAIFDHDLTLDRLAACTTIEVGMCARSGAFDRVHWSGWEPCMRDVARGRLPAYTTIQM